MQRAVVFSNQKSVVTFAEIGEEIRRQKTHSTSISISEYPLFRATAEAGYRQLGKVLPDDINDSGAVCAELYKWYNDRYTAMGLTRGKRGASNRNVNENSTEESYHFDRLYDDATFNDCLLGSKTPTSEFILHLCVAFMLTPKETDELLKSCGYQELHVKNIHHLAIYTVLAELERGQLSPETTNPFSVVRELYTEAKACLERNPLPSGKLTKAEEEAFRDLLTQDIREFLMEQNILTAANFLTYIEHHAHAYNWRHSKLLAEHKKLSNLFVGLYDNEGKSKYWDEEASEYSFWKFYSSYCYEMERKRYNDNLITQIQKKGTHPTREAMILLWMYAYSFCGTHDTKCRDTYLKKYRLAEAGNSRDNERTFDIHQYLLGGKKPLTSAYVWKGDELIQHINTQLREHSWGPLLSKAPFDYYIQKLKPLMVSCSSEGVKIFYNNKRVEDVEVPDNVPVPLYAIHKIFRAVGMMKLPQVKETKNRCPLYEQL